MQKYFVIDLETTGLPVRYKNKKGCPQYYSYKEDQYYDKSRIVQISWGVYDHNGTELKVVDHVIRPNGFIITNTKHHWVSQDYAMQNGINFSECLGELFADIKDCDQIIAYNIGFDLAILRNELFRAGDKKIINLTYCIPKYCCMRRFKKLYNNSKWIKLTDAYAIVSGKIATNAHNSLYDVRYAMEIFMHIIKHPDYRETRG